MIRPPLIPKPPLPPGARSRAALGLTAAAARGRFELQVCAACGTVQYPPREACHRCLSGSLRWREQSGTGELIADTVIHHSNDAYFRGHLPWRLGLVRFDAGPTAVVHLHGHCAPAPSRVRVGARLDKSGQGVLLAFPIDEVPNMADDPQLSALTCDPKSRKVLVTDGATQVGQAVVRALIGAGAELVWVGHAGASPDAHPLTAFEPSSKAVPVALDVGDSQSVKRLAAEIGGKVQVLINTAEAHGARHSGACGTDPRDGGDPRGGIEAARAEMDVNYFGLLHLAQEFGPAMQGAVAWVNLLSVYALSNFPPQGTFSASKAAALSLSQCLRAEMRTAGVRVINVFPGPIDDKLSPDAVARSIVASLKDGVEDVYPGEVAQEWLARWQESPKILERELGA